MFVSRARFNALNEKINKVRSEFDAEKIKNALDFSDFEMKLNRMVAEKRLASGPEFPESEFPIIPPNSKWGPRRPTHELKGYGRKPQLIAVPVMTGFMGRGPRVIFKPAVLSYDFRTDQHVIRWCIAGHRITIEQFLEDHDYFYHISPAY